MTKRYDLSFFLFFVFEKRRNNSLFNANYLIQIGTKEDGTQGLEDAAILYFFHVKLIKFLERKNMRE